MTRFDTILSNQEVSVLVAGKTPLGDLPVSLTKVADTIPLASGAGTLDASWAPTAENPRNFADLGYSNGWTDGATTAGYCIDPFGRIHLSGQITAGSLDSTVVTLPALYLPAIDVRFACPYRDNDFAIVQVTTAGDVSVLFAPSDPASESIALDGANFRAA